MICIFHSNCPDGFTAAWVVNKYFSPNNPWGKPNGRRLDILPRAINFVGGVYQNDPPDCKDRDVIMVDFAYTGKALESILSVARSVLILDHHKSSMETLEGFKHPKLNAVFDMDRSGAGLAWDFFFAQPPLNRPDDVVNCPRPIVLNHIENRDLGGPWGTVPYLENTNEICEAVMSYDYLFENWDWIMQAKEGDWSESKENVDQIASYQRYDNFLRDGEAILRFKNKSIAELLKVNQRTMKIGGYEVPCANMPYFFSSEAGNIMAEKAPFSACYWDTKTGRSFSLRSTENGLDVAKIAQMYGGGGHARASGFRQPIGWEGDK
jgi:uncharacterized protein